MTQPEPRRDAHAWIDLQDWERAYALTGLFDEYQEDLAAGEIVEEQE